MTNNSILKKCNNYYQLCKSAALIKYPKKMHAEILEYSKYVYYKTIFEIYQITLNRLLLLHNSIDPKNVARDKLNWIIGRIHSGMNEVKKLIPNPTISSKKTVSNIQLIKNVISIIPIPNIQSFNDIVNDFTQLIDYIVNILLNETIEVDMDFSDLDPQYLRENTSKSSKQQLLINLIGPGKSSKQQKPDFFKKLKVNIRIDASGSTLNPNTLGSYDMYDGILTVNLSKITIDSIVSMIKGETNLEIGSTSKTLKHELRHLVQNYIDWKTGKRKFNSKGELCNTDSDGNILIDSNGDAIKSPAINIGWSGQRKLSDQSKHIINNTITLDRITDPVIKRKILNFLNIFSLPENTVINNQLLTRQVNILKLMQKLSPNINLDDKIKAIDEVSSILENSPYLLSSGEYETWLADMVYTFNKTIKDNLIPYNKEIFEQFVGITGVTENTHAFFEKLHNFDIPRWRKAVSTLWSELNKQLSLNCIEDGKKDFLKFITINNLPKNKNSFKKFISNTLIAGEVLKIPNHNDINYFPNRIRKLKSENNEAYGYLSDSILRYLSESVNILIPNIDEIKNLI